MMRSGHSGERRCAWAQSASAGGMEPYSDHPFADGNHRVGFVALSAALWSWGLPNVEFEEDHELIAHDDELLPALLSKQGDIEPFATLLAELIERSTASGT
jgi:Fic family protein